MTPFRIALVGDYSAGIVAHRAIDESIRLASGFMPIDARWVPTAAVRPGQAKAAFCGIWCVPGSPYASLEGALAMIRLAREHSLPFLGTCGGFQHAVLEFVRNRAGRPDASHGELDPGAADQAVVPLACPLVEKTEHIRATGAGRFPGWYGSEPRREGFHCSYGLNPCLEPVLERHGMVIVARGETGEARGIELKGHPFFVGTLFQPERAALDGVLHPLVRAFLEACARVGRAAA